MNAFLAILSAVESVVSHIDPLGAALVILGIILYAEMKSYERRPGSTFRIVDFFVDKMGKADKYSLGYLVILGLSAWAMWYLTLHDRLTEWFLTIVVSAFALGAAWKSGISVYRDKIAADAAPDPPPAQQQTTEVKQTTTTVVPAAKGKR